MVVYKKQQSVLLWYNMASLKFSMGECMFCARKCDREAVHGYLGIFLIESCTIQPEWCIKQSHREVFILASSSCWQDTFWESFKLWSPDFCCCPGLVKRKAPPPPPKHQKHTQLNPGKSNKTSNRMVLQSSVQASLFFFLFFSLPPSPKSISLEFIYIYSNIF